MFDTLEKPDTKTEPTLDTKAETTLDESQTKEKSKKLSLREILKFPLSWKEVKKAGWKFVAAFFIFYLVRDTILYIIIPYLIYKGVISF